MERKAPYYPRHGQNTYQKNFTNQGKFATKTNQSEKGTTHKTTPKTNPQKFHNDIVKNTSNSNYNKVEKEVDNNKIEKEDDTMKRRIEERKKKLQDKIKKDKEEEERKKKEKEKQEELKRNNLNIKQKVEIRKKELQAKIQKEKEDIKKLAPIKNQEGKKQLIVKQEEAEKKRKEEEEAEKKRREEEKAEKKRREEEEAEKKRREEEEAEKRRREEEEAEKRRKRDEENRKKKEEAEKRRREEEAEKQRREEEEENRKKKKKRKEEKFLEEEDNKINGNKGKFKLQGKNLKDIKSENNENILNQKRDRVIDESIKVSGFEKKTNKKTNIQGDENRNVNNQTDKDKLFNFCHESIEEGLNILKPFYTITINEREITVTIILNQDKEENSKIKASLINNANFYTMSIQGDKKPVFEEIKDNEDCTIECGHFSIIEELPINITNETITEWESTIQTNDMGSAIITFSPK